MARGASTPVIHPAYVRTVAFSSCGKQGSRGGHAPRTDGVRHHGRPSKSSKPIQLSFLGPPFWVPAPRRLVDSVAASPVSRSCVVPESSPAAVGPRRPAAGTSSSSPSPDLPFQPAMSCDGLPLCLCSVEPIALPLAGFRMPMARVRLGQRRSGGQSAVK